MIAPSTGVSGRSAPRLVADLGLPGRRAFRLQIRGLRSPLILPQRNPGQLCSSRGASPSLLEEDNKILLWSVVGEKEVVGQTLVGEAASLRISDLAVWKQGVVTSRLYTAFVSRDEKRRGSRCR